MSNVFSRFFTDGFCRIVVRTLMLVSVAFLAACSGSSSSDSSSAGETVDPAVDTTISNGFYVSRSVSTIEALNSESVLDVSFVLTTEHNLLDGMDTIEEITTNTLSSTSRRAIRNFNSNGWLLFETYNDDGSASQTFTYDYNDNGMLNRLVASSIEFSQLNSRRVYAYKSMGLDTLTFYDEVDVLDWVETYSYNSDGVVIGSNLVREDRGLSTPRMNRECEIIYSEGKKSRVDCYDYFPGDSERSLQSTTEMEYDANGNLIKDTRAVYKVALSPGEPEENSVLIGRLIDRSTIELEYSQTDRDVPNETPFGALYYPTR